MFKFITGKPLWVNILFGLVLIFIILFAALLSLDSFTRHGETLTIPQVTNLPFAQAEQKLKAQGFDIEIQDSVYSDTAKPLSVLRQFPEADAVVKENRTIYLTITRAVPPTIEMPNLENMSFRAAQLVLKQYGLKLKDTVFRPDFAKNSVLEQQYDGQRIKPGTRLEMGSSITLILGSGLGQMEFNVPDLFSLTYNEARMILESTGLNAGAVISDPDVTDTLNAYIYRQSPERFTYDNRLNRIRPGQIIDIWLSKQKPVREYDPTDPDNINSY